MNNVLQSLYLYAILQLVLTSFLVILLWALYFRLRRSSFFAWWACAWTCFGAYLASSSISLYLGPLWTAPKMALIAVLLLSGFLEIVFLVFGALSWRRAASASRKWLWVSLGSALAGAVICFLLGYAWRSDMLASMAIRNLPRTFLLALALFCCSAVFFRWSLRTRSLGSAVTGIFCLAYGVDQVIYTLNFLEMVANRYSVHFPWVAHQFASIDSILRSGLFFIDIIDTSGICLGVILLLLEEHRQVERNLEESEQRSFGLAENNVALQFEIQERHRVEAALRESEERYRDLVDNSEDLFCIHDVDGRILSINPAPARSLGYSVEELLQMNIKDFLLPRLRAQFPAFIERVLTRGLDKGIMAVLTRKGEKRIWEYTSTVRSTEQLPIVIRGMAHDVTAAKRAESGLRDHAMFLDALIANSPIGIVVKDEQQRVRFCNPAFERMFQYTQAELVGKKLDDIIATHDHEEARRLTLAARSGGPVHSIAQRRRKDGSLLDVELFGVRLFADNSFVGAFALYQDITDRRRAEEKVQALRSRITRAQEEERARIARDLHDDAGQHLALLCIDLEQLKQTLQLEKSSLVSRLDLLAKNAREITSIVHSASRRLHPAQVDLLGLDRALVNFCRDFSARSNMEIEFLHENIPSKTPQDVALCLFRITQEAVHNVQKHSGASRALVELHEIDGVLSVRVSDYGSGFDPDSLGSSSGLGLVSMKERVRSMGGELVIHSQRGRGTSVEASIPIPSAITAPTETA